MIVLDQHGTVIAVSQGANPLTSKNALKPPLPGGVGSNFLGICREAERNGDKSAGQLASAVESVLAGKEEQFTMNYPGQLSFPQPCLSLSVVPLMQPSPFGCVVTFFDGAPRRQVDMELARQRDVLALESRVYALSELAAGLTHELTQPLTAMSYYCDTLQALEENTDTWQDAATRLIGRIGVQVSRAMKVVSQLRDFLRRLAPDLSVLSFNALLGDVIELTEILAQERNVRLSLSVPGDLPPVMGDARQLQQVLMHLLRNAIEAAGSMQERDRRVSVVATYDPEWVYIIVKDNGPGMDQSLAREIFDVIKTSTAQRLGFGLGICQSIVHAHGGRLWLATASTEGSCFQFTLPIAGKSHAP